MEELIEKLRDRKIDVDVVNNQLKLGVPEGQFVDDLIDEIKENKFQLIQFISKIKNGNGFSSIKPSKPKRYYALSSAQKRLYFLHQLLPDGLGYNVTQTIKILGEVSKEKIRTIFQELISRHEILRTVFELVDEQPFQRVLPTMRIEIEYSETQEAKLASMAKSFVRPFLLDRGPLIRVGLFQIAKEEYVLIVDMHHIITDGISMGILMNEFTSLYQGEKLESLSLQYKDYAEWQQSKAQKKIMKSQEQFWLREFENEVYPLQTPIDSYAVDEKKKDGGTFDFFIPKREKKAISDIAKSINSTQFVVYLAIYNVLLSKVGYSEDVVVGNPTAGRQHADVASMIGMFVNTLPIRNFPLGKKTFSDFLIEVKEKVLQCFEHQLYQYENLIEKLNLERHSDKNPLFDVVFAFQNFKQIKENPTAIAFEPYDIGERVALFDLSLTVFEGKDEMLVNFQYDTKKYKTSTIKKFATYYLQIIKTIVADLTISLGDISLVTNNEKQQILNEFNDTKIDYPDSSHLVQLFEAIAESKPNKIAINENDRCFSYEYLNSRSNQIAHLLKPNIKKQECLGILTDRSSESIIAMLAILKAGGVYVPLDPEYPLTRIEKMLHDAEISTILCQDAYAALLPNNYVTHSINYSGLDYDKHNLKSETKGSDLAYIMYTSGSTGTPKGVMVTHKNIIRLVVNNNFITLSSKSRVLQTGAIVFDAATFEIWGSLLNGGLLQIVSKEVLLQTSLFKKIVNKEKINMLWLTSALFDRHTREDKELYKNLSYLLVGGDKLTPSTINLVRNAYPNLKIINGYGPTENTTFSTCFLIDNDYNQNIPIGKPIANSTAYILDKFGNLLPVGVPGELFVGGDGVANGYVNNSELTKNRFINNPFLGHSKMYKTGDLARWLPDGNIEFLGRIDNQVKIRGFRVELGEIENQLNEHPDIKAVAVLARVVQNQKSIVAYYVSKRSIKEVMLRNFLEDKLPEYMVPSYFTHLDHLPLTTNGKLFKRGLPTPTIDLEYELVKPANDIEQQLAKIWSAVLNLPVAKLSTTSNFFSIGGHSLKASYLVNKIHKELNIAIPLREIFKLKNIQNLADYIQKSDKSRYDAIPKAASNANYVLSSAQKRMYFLFELDKSSTSYNMPQAVRLKGTLNSKKLSDAIDQLILRHEILRTSFHINASVPFQQVQDTVDFKIELKLCQKDNVHRELQSFIAPFDLSQAPLLRMTLLELEKEEYVLLVDKHHIISDGVSEGIFINDFVSLYNGITLPKLEYQYKDFAVWQQSKPQLEANKNHRKFWLKVYDEIPERLLLPTDFQRPSKNSYAGDSVSFEFSETETSALIQLAKKHECTMFITLLSAFSILLHKISQAEDIVIGTPVAGREHLNLEGILGMFVNTLALRTQPKSELTFESFLENVKNHVLACFEHQQYPYETLVDELELERDTTRSPLIDVMFSFDHMEHSELNIPGVSMEEIQGDHQRSKFDMSMFVIQDGEKLFFTLMYASSIFKRNTIESFVSYFKLISKAIISNASIKLSSIEILESEQKRHLLEQFAGPKTQYPKDKTIVDLFEHRAKEFPDKIAVSDNLNQISYSELDSRSDKLANYLIKNGVGSNCVVALLLDRSVEMIIGILGILKTQSAYLPLATDHSLSRNLFMIESSSASILVTKGEMGASYASKIKTVDISAKHIYTNTSNTKHNRRNTGNVPVYVIYTSGSTGKPKGVKVKNQALVNLVTAQIKCFAIDEWDKVLQFSTYTFDASIEQVWITLLSGSTLILIQKERILRVETFKQFLHLHAITHLHATPTFLQSVNIEGLKRLKRVVSAGESCPMQLAKRLSRDYKFFNKYGLTETTITSTIYCFPNNGIQGKLVPIGKPLANTSIYILSPSMALVPVGVPGEIHIGGDGLTEAYLNDKRLSKKRYVSNPFIPGEKIYKTGDFGRWKANGDIEYLGRRDEQVKLRGHRIELQEIAYHLLKHDDITNAEVLVKGEENEKRLMGYYVSGSKLDAEELSSYLLGLIPSYMVPHNFIKLEKIPLTARGKVDKKLLLSMGEKLENPTFPITATEQELVDIWSEILELDKNEISTSASFFSLGGHSLKAINVVNAIRKRLLVNLALKDIFQYQKIISLAKVIDSSLRLDYNPIQPVINKANYVLSSAQKRMYFLYEFDPTSTSYNMPQAVRLKGLLDVPKLTLVFNRLIERHEILRTSFLVVGTEPVQQVHSEVSFSLDYQDCQANQIENEFQSFILPFELAKPPLIRCKLLKIDEREHVLLLDKHHIISDGVSEAIFIKEIINAYNEVELPKIELHYKDYAVWQQSDKQLQSKDKDRKFWKLVFEDMPNSLNLALDRPRLKVGDSKGDSVSFVLSKEESAVLQKIASGHDSTMFMVILSLFSILLHKLSHQNDIVIGTPVAGRQHLDLERILGLFVNTVAIRTKPKVDSSFLAFLSELRIHILSCFDHQNFPYEELIDELEVERNTGRNPLFDVMFSYINQEHSSMKIQGLDIIPHDSNHKISKFDLSLSAGMENDQVFLVFEYATSLFNRETIKNYAAFFKRIVSIISNDPRINIKDIDLLTAQQKDTLINKFNPPEVRYPEGKTVIDLFERKVVTQGNQNAIYWNDRTISYRNLNERVNQLANHLMIEKGINPNDIVGLHVERGAIMLISLLAVLKAGATFLPLELDYPSNRIGKIIDESDMRLIITKDRDLIKDLKPNLASVDYIRDEMFIANSPKENLKLSIQGNQAAYIIYTSGTSGVPKGVIIDHDALLDYTITFKNYFKIEATDKVIQQSLLSFDTAIEEIFPSLVSGASLILLDEGGKDIEKMIFAIENLEATVLSTTPLVLNELNTRSDEIKNLRVIISGGDVLFPKYISNLIHKFPIYNSYGPTESTVCISYNQLNNVLDATNIGKPITNRQVYILDVNNRLCPIGVPGELCVGGKGLAKGYINNTKLTNQKFIENPYKPGERLYKTGDLARWLSNGTIDFMGRIDNQVKIRGYRVELEEIQNCMLSLDQINDAILIAHEHGSEKRLIAYYLSESHLDHQFIATHLKHHLPQYMIPNHFIRIDELPKTSNGKIDKKQLPTPIFNSSSKFESPVSKTEIELSKIWSEILNISKNEIDINQDFFELGGQSLKANKLKYKIAYEFKVEIPLVEIFLSPTIKNIAKFIDKSYNIGFGNHESAVLLNRSLITNNQIFWIHDGSGDVFGYIEASRRLKSYTSWGVKSPLLQSIVPKTLQVTDVINDYINIIKEIQPVGPYHIAGWSLGGEIAYKICKELETRNEVVEHLIMIDTKFSNEMSYEQTLFTLESEKTIIKELFNESLPIIEASNSVTMLWTNVIKILNSNDKLLDKFTADIPVYIQSLIPPIQNLTSEELVSHINTIRSLMELQIREGLAGAIQAKTTYVKAFESKRNVEKIKSYFGESLHYSCIKGDHFSIMQQPYVDALVDTITWVLKSRIKAQI